MANPNIAALTTIYGTTTAYTPSGTTAVVLLPNPAASGQVYRINTIICANIDGTNPVNATVAYYTNGAVAQGSAPSGGVTFAISSTISVPANASLIAVDKTTQIYVLEGTSIIITSGTASKMTFLVSYEVMA